MVTTMNANDQSGEGFAPGNCKRLVVKIGSSLLVDDNGQMRKAWLQTVCDDVAAQISAGQKVIIVSSGAIALGARRLGLVKGGRDSLADAQAAAAVGQMMLSGLWSRLLAKHGLLAAQMLLTLDDMESRRRYLNATTTLEKLVEIGAVPVINENDSVATEEIRFGDNDRLAASVAQAVQANGLVLISDVDGLYTANPSNDPDAKHIPHVENIDSDINALADDGKGSSMGTGGMSSKIAAARMATQAGIRTAIVSGRHDNPLRRLTNENAGTLFAPRQGAGAARKTWLAARKSVAGTLMIDTGAVRALRQGASLLAAGIVEVEGDFHRGDLVTIQTLEGETLAQGLIEYDATSVRRIIGHRSEEHEALLGLPPRSAVVHRDDMVLL